MDNDFATGYALGADSNNGNAGMWGDGGQWIWVILILAMFGGGWGGYGGFGGNSAFQGALTRQDLSEGFALNNITRGISGIQQGICDSTYALTNVMNSGFSSAELARCNQQAALMAQLNSMAFQAQDCCCQTQGAIKDVRFDMSTLACAAQNTANNNTRDIIQSTHNDTDRILAALNQMEATRQAEKIEALRLENQTLKFQASQAAQNSFISANQEAQTAELLRRIAPTPTPAYMVPNPNGCGCGCGYGYGCNY